MKLGKILMACTTLLLLAGIVAAQENTESATPSGKEMAAALAIGVAALGAGYGVGVAGSASVGAIAEKPEVFGRALVFVAFAETIAIYGLLVALMILFGIGA
ncbi:MAG: V-type ATP synthase subunit K [Candidatus Altiarchaeales archaeon ex4484_96]|nr:MAG: V-type ATP synthase subunit K [Candidatus Altiarchaeales archaeon ex4484_96]